MSLSATSTHSQSIGILLLGVLAAACSSTTAPTVDGALTVGQSTAMFNALAGGSSPEPISGIPLHSSGSDVLENLTVDPIAYDSAVTTPWLEVLLGDTKTPTTMTIRPVTGALSAGVHTATIAIHSNAPGADTTSRTVKVTVTIEGFVSVTAGGNHSCGLTESGVAYCWGSNINGQLGDGTITTRTSATRVSGSNFWRQIEAGNQSTCALNVEGVAYCWGGNSVGQLGTNSFDNATVPTAVVGGLLFDEISVGYSHACGRTPAGVGFCWGGNALGVIGDGMKGAEFDRRSPTAISGGLTFTAISAGWFHTCGLISGGVPYCWGQNTNRQLGFAAPTNPAAPVLVDGSLPMQNISAGWMYTCGVTLSGMATCWGGLISGTNPVAATQPGGSIGTQIFRKISVGNSRGCGRAESGVLYCFEADQDGSLRSGDGVQAPGNVHFSSIAVGQFHKCAIGQDGFMYCWGINTSGQLGDATKLDHVGPMPVKVQ